MGTRLNLKGETYGVLEVIEPAEDKMMGCGTVRTFWNVRCTRCGWNFDIQTKTLRRNEKPSVVCKHCKDISNQTLERELGCK